MNGWCLLINVITILFCLICSVYKGLPVFVVGNVYKDEGNETDIGLSREVAFIMINIIIDELWWTDVKKYISLTITVLIIITLYWWWF